MRTEGIHARVRRGLAAGVALLLLGAAALTFWYQDWQYNLPTPRPPGLNAPPTGVRLALAGWAPQKDPRPLFLHFFNPQCPCSRFNLAHIRELLRSHGQRARFVAVLQGDDSRAAQASFDSLGLDMEALPDPHGRLAAVCGVYSTPQAVIVDPAGRLYWRGNYNASRYCTNRRTEFARLALESVLERGAMPQLPPPATIAYGCPLPRDRRRTEVSR